MQYALLNNSTKALELYSSPGSAGVPFAGKLSVGTIAYGSVMSGVWLKTYVKGNNGWIDTRQGSLTINDDVPEEPPPPAPAPDNLVYIKGYYEVYGMSNPEYRGVLLGKEDVYAGIYGLPAAIKMFNTKQINIRPGTITRKLWLELFTEHAPWGMSNDTINKKFIGLLKNGVCYTDYAGNIGFNQIITSNNFAYSMGSPQRKAGEMYRPIRCLKVGSYNFMRDQVTKYPYIVSEATISNQFDDGRGVDPFWHLNGNPVKVPQFCFDEVNWILEKWIQPITDITSLPERYYPVRAIG